MTRRQRSSRSATSATVRVVMPAELTSTSTRPYEARAASTTASVSAREVTSPGATTNAPPTFPSASATPEQACRLTSLTTSFAPSAANRRAQAAPIPDAAPVTTATLSFNRSDMGMGSPRSASR